MEMRCDSKLHGVLEDGRIEVKCSSRFCGADRHTVVLHYFAASTGKLLTTKKLREPKTAFDREKERA